MRATATTFLVALTLGAAPAAAQTIEAGEIKLKLIGRIQTQFSTTSVDEAELIAAGASPEAISGSTFELRRLRFGSELEYEQWLTGKIEMEFAMARVQTRDAFMNINFGPRLNLRVGQFKKPFGMLQLHSSSTWPVIERGVRIRGLSALLSHQNTAAGDSTLGTFRGSIVLPDQQELLEVFGYQNFDIGAALHGRLGGFGYNIGVFNGNGSDRLDDTDGQSVAARLTFKLPTELPVTFGTALSRRTYRVASRPQIRTDAGTAYEFDVEIGAFRRPGLHMLGEVAVGDNLATDEQFLGSQAVIAWFKPLAHTRFDGLEVAARASYGDPRRDSAEDSAWLLTPGLNLYFSGRNRLMFNWDFFTPSGARFSSENAMRAQAQLYF